MPKRKATPSAPAEAGPVAVPLPLQETAKSSSALRFPVLVTSSFILSLAGHQLASHFTEGDLAAVSRSTNEWAHIAGFLGGRVVELGLGWWGQYDGVDMASLTLLSHLPYYQLLRIFYGIRPTTILSSLSIDMLSVYIPLYFLRAKDVTHDSHAPKSAVSNRSVINDFSVQLLTSLLATIIYGMVLFTSLKSWLPTYLVTHFDGLKSLDAAHEAAQIFVLIGALPLGFAAKSFIFTPSMGGKPDARDAKNAAFDPVTATFWETVKYNAWGHSKRVRTLVKRTTTLIAFTGLYTWLQVYYVVEGAEFLGAAGWSAVWAAAATITGFAYLWVGDVEGVSN